MRRTIILSLAVVATLGASRVALAQDVGVEIYGSTGPTYYGGYAGGYSPPVYGYYRSEAPDRTIILRTPTRPPSCGVYRYWDGQACVDARVVPPDVR